MPRKSRLDPTLLRDQIRQQVAGEKVEKTMKCGHKDFVFPAVDETTEVCWACRMPGFGQSEKE